VTKAIRAVLQAALRFEVPGRTVHAPQVEARIRGVTTRLIVDSGASDHLLTVELAKRCQIDMQPGEPGTDSTGAAVPSWRVGTLDMDVGQTRVRLSDVVAFDGPSQFTEDGIGGFLSPQNLDPSAFAVIDLSGSQLLLMDCDVVAMEKWLGSRYPGFRLLSLTRELGETVEVSASIEPYEPVVAMLDTGGKATEFAASSVPGLRGVPSDRGGRGVSGAGVEGQDVADQTLVVGGARFALPVLRVRETMPIPGQIGMDVLRGTVLVVSAVRERPIYWLVPST
jgi:hypothetical protein